jgi:hypothetical protein
MLLGSTLLPAQETDLSIFPFFAYSRETKFMVGAFSTYVRTVERDSTNNKFSVSSLAIYTSNHQFQILTSPQYKLNNDHLRFGADFRGRNWPDKFYGIGNSTSADSYEKYVQKQFKIRLDTDVRLGGKLYAGAKLAAVRENIADFNPQNIPLEGSYHGLNRAQNYYGWGAKLNYNNTDNDYYPQTGMNYSFSYIQYYNPAAETQSRTFGLSSLELNNYFNPAEGTVLALQGSYTGSSPSIPFSFMPELGSALRAFDSKRYIDKMLIAGRAELRIFPSELSLFSSRDLFQQAFFKKCGFVLFSELGQVAHSEKEFLWKENHHSNGLGLRYRVSEALKLNVRADFAYGSDGLNLIVQGSEAF